MSANVILPHFYKYKKKVNDATDSNAICDVRPKTISLKNGGARKIFGIRKGEKLMRSGGRRGECASAQ